MASDVKSYLGGGSGISCESITGLDKTYEDSDIDNALNSKVSTMENEKEGN